MHLIGGKTAGDLREASFILIKYNNFSSDKIHKICFMLSKVFCTSCGFFFTLKYLLLVLFTFELEPFRYFLINKDGCIKYTFIIISLNYYN